MSKLDNKVAVITGGNSGIGLAAAKRFAAEGAQVVITGRRSEAVQEAVSSIGANVTGIVAEASSLADTDRMMDQIQADHGRIDVLFINAGVAPFGGLSDTDETNFDRVFDINVKGLFFTLQKALPLMTSGASVILTASVLHKAGYAGANAYAASKAAVRSIGQSAAVELAPQGIRVNLLSPGLTETPIFGKTGLPPEAIADFGAKVGAIVPMGRMGTPDEIASVALFLACDDSNYVTGADIQADGGYSQKFE